ncbi:mite allergen Der p 3-like [Maniola jurtina]|uniref:mite allergen Der p 3-like n=1 Tax=Maniola jurtina TaxID=191418 RepID=UPI001E68BBED|nr:mite allergen Der p 3-like [Maniola jurtina]
MLTPSLLRIILVIVKLFVDWKFCEAGLRIIGGRNALKDEFPFAVRLEIQLPETRNGTEYFEYHQFCTGTALSPSWILTAAHCYTEGKKFARYNSYFPEELGHLSPITKVIAHPSFIFDEFSSITRVKYDLALYQTEKLKISSYGKISAIDYTTFVGHEVFVLGFGITNASALEKPLQVLKGILINCDERISQGLIGMLCIVPQCGLEASVCPGDSGGPAVHASGIVGVHSITYTLCERFDHGLLRPGLPSDIITMVSPVVDWISKIVANETDNSP